MRICLFGSFDRDYVRNIVLTRALQSQGMTVELCHAELWPPTDARIAAVRKGWRSVGLMTRMLRAHWQLLRQHAHLEPYDALIVGYPGYFEAPLARLLAWLRRRPLVFDAFISLSETVVEDRALLAARSLLARLIWLVDWLAVRLADMVLVDTPANAEYYHSHFGVPIDRLLVLPVGADEAAFYARQGRGRGTEFRVLYFGKFIPLHGIEHILRAAHILRDQTTIRFVMVGGGQTYDAMHALAGELALDNILWGPKWLPPNALADEISQADVCLGIFGASAKARRVIPTKAYVALAMAKPLITMDSPAAREILTSGQEALLCQPANPESLAEAILSLRDDPSLRQRLADRGRALFQQRFSTPAIGRLLAERLRLLMASIERSKP